ncbi:MAG: dTDP-4-dehydrorhamnose 3,5-epimerase family protein [Patescibacteria group bacterium]|nr:dTDP-4-dehydrorhamnose 3,5-epimerase family protein [Patescibacteria group bacterium]
MIQGVKTKKLKIIPDERGRVMEILRNDDECYEKFGQVYMTTNYPGVIKAWHYHKIQTDNVVCAHGMLKVVLYDNREDSPTKGEINEFFVGEHNPLLIHIPPMIYHGWKNIGECEAIAVSVPTEAYNYKEPDEYRLSYDDPSIPYNWEIKMG